MEDLLRSPEVSGLEVSIGPPHLGNIGLPTSFLGLIACLVRLLVGSLGFPACLLGLLLRLPPALRGILPPPYRLIPLPQNASQSCTGHQHHQRQQACHRRPPLHPPQTSLPHRQRPRLDRLAGPEAPQVVGQLARRRVSPPGLL